MSLAGVVLAAVILVLLANVGNKVTEKSIVVNAADAAAYSGATWVARQLNFMAYTNRAMIANHIGVGHFVAYMSWIRYVEQVAERVDDVAQFIPIVNAISGALEEFATVLRELAEAEGKIYVPAVDGLNAFYSAAQIEAHAFMNPERIDEIMNEAGKRYDPAVEINDSDALTDLSPVVSVPIVTALALQSINVVRFVAPLKPTDRSSELVRLVENSYGAENGFFEPQGSMSTEWLLDRGYELDLFTREVEKKFTTDHTLTNDLTDWEATDELVVREFFGKGPEITLASGEASAREFSNGYRGIRRYYNLRDEDTGHPVLPILAYASKDQTRVKTHDVFGLESESIPLSGLAIAQVEHERPENDFEPLSLGGGFFGRITQGGEYANVYNPFWRARLVGAGLFDLPTAFPDVELPDFD